MNLIDHLLQIPLVDSFHRDEESEWIIHLWSTADERQRILIDTLFVRLVGKTLSALIQQTDSDSYEQAMHQLALKKARAASEVHLVWQVIDIKSMRPDLDDSQCRTVLKELKRRHDKSIGIDCAYYGHVEQSLRVCRTP